MGMLTNLQLTSMVDAVTLWLFILIGVGGLFFLTTLGGMILWLVLVAVVLITAWVILKRVTTFLKDGKQTAAGGSE